MTDADRAFKRIICLLIGHKFQLIHCEKLAEPNHVDGWKIDRSFRVDFICARCFTAGHNTNMNWGDEID